MEIQIDVNKVIQKLQARLSDEQLKNAILEAQLDSLAGGSEQVEQVEEVIGTYGAPEPILLEDEKE